jgi:hypothetical protein
METDTDKKKAAKLFLKLGLKQSKSNKILDVKQSIEKTTEMFFGGALATAVTLTLHALFGISTIELMGAILIGYNIGKIIITKTLPKIIKSFKPSKKTEVVSTPTQEREFTPDNPTHAYGSNIGSKINSSAQKSLIGSASVYLVAHFIAPLLPKIIAALPVITPILQVVALAIPGLQTAAVVVFAITIAHVIYKKHKAYKIEKANRELAAAQSSDPSSPLPDQGISVKGPNITATASRETLAAFVGVVICNFSFLALQIAALVLGLKIVMPIAGIILGSFIAAFTVFYAIPAGTYKIVVSLKKQDVRTVSPKASLTQGNQDTLKNKKEEQVDLGVRVTRLNQVFIIATIAMVTQHIVKVLFQLPFLQHFALIATAFVAATAVALVIIPRIINKRRLNAFKKSETFIMVQGQTNSIKEQLAKDGPEIHASNRTDNAKKAQELFSSRPDIVLACLLTAYKGEKNDKGKDIADSLEVSLVQHGFRDINVAIEEMSDHTLALITKCGEACQHSTLAGPYFQKESERSISLAEQAIETLKPSYPTPEPNHTPGADLDHEHRHTNKPES